MIISQTLVEQVKLSRPSKMFKKVKLSKTFETRVENAKSEFAAFQEVAVRNVYHLFHCLFINKATGIDKISRRIIKKAAPSISDSLTYICNQVITLCCFPDEWKTAKVVSLYINGKRNVPCNYRPIYVWPAISQEWYPIIKVLIDLNRHLYRQSSNYIQKNRTQAYTAKLYLGKSSKSIMSGTGIFSIRETDQFWCTTKPITISLIH